MKKRLHDKKAGIAILISLIIISVAEIIFRATVMKEFVFTTENLGEQLIVIALAATILFLTAKGKDRGCYILYGAWAFYFVFDQLFELPGVIVDIFNPTILPGNEIFVFAQIGMISHALAMCGVVAIGAFILEYMTDGTICNRAFNIVCLLTLLFLITNILPSTLVGIFTKTPMLLLETFYGIYRIVMVFLLTFFAYDSAKAQLKKINLAK